MGKPYSMDLRERVVTAIEGGMSTRQAATRFLIGIATAGTWARLKRAAGTVAPARQGKPKGSVLDPHAEFIFGLIAEAPDITLEEITKVVPTQKWFPLPMHALENVIRIAASQIQNGTVRDQRSKRSGDLSCPR